MNCWRVGGRLRPRRCSRWFGLTVACAAVTVSIGYPAQSVAQDDNPILRWEYFYNQRAYPFGTIAPGALSAARQQLSTVLPGFRALGPSITTTPWQQIGPERIPLSIQSAGRLSAIAVHPANPSIIYIGAAQGGVWKTVDGGSSWTPLTDQQCSLAMGSIALDPVNPDIVYAGTGEQHFSGDSYYGCGVLRSADGGATWTRLEASVFTTSAPGPGARVSRVVIDPATAGTTTNTTVLVASDFGLYRSTNSGASWTSVLTGTATDLVMDPTNSAVLYAGIFADGVSKSIDGGVTWSALTTGLPTAGVGRVNLAIAPSAPQTLYAAVHNTSGNGLSGIFKTTDGGNAWTQLSATNAGCGAQCWYDMIIAVHPTNPDTVYFGGISLFRSTDGGTNFISIGGNIHVDQHFLTFDTQNPDIVYVGNDGGIYKSSDAGSTWSTLNTNLVITQFYPGVSLHPTDPNVAMGGTQDNGTVGFTGTADWDLLFGGDGGFTAIDLRDRTVRYTETQWTASAGFSGPRRSDGGSFGLKTAGIDVSDRALFIPPLVMDRVDPQVLYFGTFRLYRTTDRAESWVPISSDLTTGGSISAIAVSLSDPAVIYAGSSTGDLHVTMDGGGAWTAINASLPNRFITDIALHEVDPRIALVTLSGFGSGHVFKTTDAGASWLDVSANLPDVPVNAILIEPGTPSIVYIGTDLGTFVSTDGGSSWSPFNDGLPQVAVFDLAIMPNTGILLAATHGRGMFSRLVDIAVSMTVLPTSTTDTVLAGTTTIVPDSARVTFTGVGAATQPWTATHGAGTWLTVTTPSGMGSDFVRWARDPAGLPRGTYVDTITVVATAFGVGPAAVVDTMVVQEALAITLGASSRADTTVAGMTALVADSVTLELVGLGSTTAGWVASHGGSSWLTIESDSGVGVGVIRWTRNAAQLAAGVFVDTITVSSPGAIGSPLMLLDTLVVAPQIALDDAASELFTGGVLSALQVAFLEASGNDDGLYNLGDVLAWIDHCEGSSPGGCVASSAAPSRLQGLPGRPQQEEQPGSRPERGSR